LVLGGRAFGFVVIVRTMVYVRTVELVCSRRPADGGVAEKSICRSCHGMPSCVARVCRYWSCRAVSFKKNESGALSEIEPVTVSTVCVSTATTGVSPPDGRMMGWEPNVTLSLKYPGQ
jgi:hypothetical protein